MTPLIQEIEREFDEKYHHLRVFQFGDFKVPNGSVASNKSLDEEAKYNIKQFIITSLQKVIEAERKSVLEEIEKKKDGYNCRDCGSEGWDSALSSIAEFIKLK